MPVQHLPPVRQTRSHGRDQAVLTPTPTAPLDGTPAVPQLRSHVDRGTVMEGEEKNSAEEEYSYGTEFFPPPVGASEATAGPTLANYNQIVFHQSEPSLLVIMHKMTQIIANLQEASILHL
ncbi:hypothetical protein O181_011885 [Austropuccinia psidii MF-1]|uniref:Uncharacterized protein n=1 Tax=Austropuccinia psidii MF-1 TaxID=1389203 RepID=A0A9Q3BWS9_9BASI|nr:hypothetical protein [Austropuccinia psidii MF-1]